MSIVSPLILLVCTSAAASPAAVEEVVITAVRTPIAIDRAPVTLDVLDRGAIVARGSAFTTDSLRGLPGIAVSESGPPGSVAEVRVRGAETSHTLVMIDGVELNDPATGSLVDFAYLDPTGLDNIEVLRGPQSALWGSDALAGVIRLSARPAPGTRTRSAAFEAGSLDTRTAALTIADATRPFYYGATATHTESGGANVATIGGEDEGYRRSSWRLNAGTRGETWSVDALAGLIDASSEYDPTPFPAFVPRDGDAEVDATRRLFGISGEKRFDAWRHTARVWRIATDNESFEDHTSIGASGAHKTHWEYQIDYELGLDNALQRFTGALEYEEEDFKGEGPVSPFGDPNQRQSFAATSGVLDYGLTYGAIDVSLSVRHDDNDEFDDATSLRAALRYAVAATGTDFFVLLGNGVKNPTFTERFGFTPDTFVGNPNLQPETGESVSIGAVQRIGERGWARAVWFNDRLEDEIDGFVFDPNVGAFTATNRDGTSKRQGVELSGAAFMKDSMSLRCDYTYLDAAEPIEGRDVDEIRRPRHSGGCRVDAAPTTTTALEIGAIYTGGRSDSDFATFPATPVNLAAYWLAHVTASWQLSASLSITARIENAFDDRYQDVFGYDTAGRRFIVGFKASLD